VSLSRPAELRVGLCPGRLVVAYLHGGFWRRSPEFVVHSVDTDPVEALRQLAGRRRCAVVLSNHLVRYALLVPSPALVSEEDWMAYGRHVFESIYGRCAREWEIRISDTGRDKPRIACAVAAALVASLREVAVVRSVRPYLMAAFNARLRILQRQRSWFVLHEAGRLVLGFLDRGSWRHIRTRQATETWTETIADLLDREGASCGTTDCEAASICAESEVPTRSGRYQITDVTLAPGADRKLRATVMAFH